MKTRKKHAELAPLLTAALAQSEDQKAKFENEATELGVIAQGLAKAAELLAGQFTLVVTNVPYLGSVKQDTLLKNYCERVYPEAKADIATCFVERCLGLCSRGGSAGLVTPQNWLSLGTFALLRKRLLSTASWLNVTRLGTKGFQTPMWDFNVVLFILGACIPQKEHALCGMDVKRRSRHER